jgi:photosystem II stability/assembly factor-like uncharacterized protein
MKHLRVMILLVLPLLFAVRGNAQWIQSHGPNGGEVRCFAASGGDLFAGTWGGGVFLSTNDGAGWTHVNVGLTNTWIYSLAVGGTNLFAGTPSGLFLSTNNGTSWHQAGLKDTMVLCLAVSPNGAGGTDLFAGTYGGGVIHSTDNGTTWTEANTGLGNDRVYALLVNNTDLFAGTEGSGVFRSTNNGGSWVEVNAGLTDQYVYSLAVRGTSLFAGTSSGAYLSADSGTHWTQTALTSMHVSSLAIRHESLGRSLGRRRVSLR